METLSNSESKIKVCFIARTAYFLFNPDFTAGEGNTHGGAEVDLFLIAKELAKDSDYKVSFIVGDFGQPTEEEFYGVSMYKCFKSSKKTKNFFIKKWNGLKNLINFIRAFKKADADIYFHEAASSITGISQILCRVFGKKFVYRTAHDMDCDKSYRKSKKGLDSIHGYVYERGIKKADVLITQNEINQNQLKENYGLKSIIIKNAHTIESIFSKEKDYVLWVARSVDWKQPHLFINLAANHPLTNFKMICPKANEDGVDWDNLIKSTEEIDNLEFIENIPFHRIDRYFKNAKVFINTSIKEGYPNTFVQATKNGTPIISLNVNPDNFLVKHDCGYYCDGDFELMNEKLNQLLDDFALWERKSQNAYKYANSEHNMDKVILEYKDIFKTLK